MKLPNFLEFEPFNRLRKQMKADLLETDELKIIIPPTVSDDELIKMQNEGLDIDIHQVEILADGTLKYKDRRILIYIRDIYVYNGNFFMPRFHFSNCNTIQEMKQKGKIKHYVASIRTDGLFDFIKITDNKEEKIKNYKLQVCKNCLSHIDYKQYLLNKNDVFNNFSLSEFFTLYPADFLNKPQSDSGNSPVNKYTDDWQEISKAKRQESKYVCHNCHVVVGQKYAHYLHVHHKNSLKNDNSDNNLECLCYKCHAEEPNHEHMKNGDYYQFLKIYDDFEKEKIDNI